MNTALFYGVSIFAAFCLVWRTASFLEARARQRKYRELEGQFRSSEAKARHLAEELAAVKTQCVGLQRDLEAGRQAQVEAAHGMRLQALRRMFRTAMGTAAGGFLLGAVLTGVIVDARTEVSAMRRMMDLEVRARVAEARFEAVHSEISGLSGENQELRRTLLEAREEKAVALTKLELLLGHFSGKKSKRGLDLDVTAIKESLRRDHDEILSPQDILAISASRV